MSKNNEKLRVFTRRALLVGGAQAALFTLLSGRLYYLQVLEGGKYHQMAEENRINMRMIAPPRGRILDRHGVPLALNDQTYRAVVLPEQVDDLGELLDRVSQHIKIEDADRRRVERDFRERRSFNAVIIRDNLTREQMEAVAVHTPELPGVDIDAGEVRYYPYGAATSHILGYVGTVSRNDIDKAKEEDAEILTVPGFRIGKNGIEKQYELHMRGEVGNVELEVNARGRVVRELVRNDPKVGNDITLNIDIGLQEFVQQRLAKEEGAAVVVMDVHTGEVISLVSQPGFDPNLFTFGISQSDWDSLNNDIHTPLLNKAITGVYAPGSAFKPVVAMAALEANIADPESRVFCPGHYELGGHTFRCWKKGGHGYVNMTEAMAGSCDTYFYDLGRRVGIDRIHSMAQRFGMGQKLGIDLPHERPGLVPSRSWKQSVRHQAWQQGETLITAIGQGYMLTSPLQLAVMVARIANNGLEVKPRIIKSIGDQNVPQEKWPSMGLDKRNLEIVRKGLFAVVNSNFGTAHGARIAQEDLAMSGKTGTAQVRRISEAEHAEGVIKNEDLPWKQRDHALFVGYAPADNPRFAVSVVIEHGGSGAHQAAPVARDVLLECQMRFKT